MKETSLSLPSSLKAMALTGVFIVDVTDLAGYVLLQRKGNDPLPTHSYLSRWLDG